MIFIGDTHGNNGYIKMVIQNLDYRDMDLIHVGDFGVGFVNINRERENLEALNDFMVDRGLTLHVIRGNHDAPRFFDGTFMYTNLKLHPDYTVLNIEGKNILLVGGAISIDRVPRREQNLTYARMGTDTKFHWEDEKFMLDKVKLGGMRDINIVVTHTAPHYAKPFDQKGFWPPIVQQFIYDDPTLGDDLVVERNLLSEMYDILDKNNNIIDWFYGHFHQNMETIHRHTTFQMLGINEMREYGDNEFDEEMEKKYNK
jgi:predicted phosphodiesterase